jgi:hypothetical protein
MKAEKVILSIFAIIVGLIAAGVAFYLYQMTKTIPVPEKNALTVKSQATPIPTPNNQNFLTIESPKDESVVGNKKITISGKTIPGSTIIISTDSNDQVVPSATDGSFTLSEIIGEGTNLIQITSVLPSGEEIKISRTVTYTTETF